MADIKWVTCHRCDGKGQTRINARPNSWRTCGDCGGSGRVKESGNG